MDTLIVLLGPTGVGKTDLSIALARRYGTSIISCDSRQVYREMRIGTAVPEPWQLAAVPHHFIGTRSVHEPYSSWQFAEDALAVAGKLFRENGRALMTGGSMLYIDAVCKGIDEIPTIPEDLRRELAERYRREGLEVFRQMLRELDPVYYAQVDLQNWKRVVHAVEVCLAAGVPYSSLRTHPVRDRGFRILRIGLEREREDLYARIDRRVDLMMEAGLVEEARALYPMRGLNALNTVGYKEIFDYMDGRTGLDEAVRLIKRNTRHYARKQLSWFRRDGDIRWFHPDRPEELTAYLDAVLAEEE